MASLLSNLVNDLSEGIHKTNCKHEHDELDMKLVEIDTKITSANIYMKRFVNTYQFSNHDINKFVLFLQKGVYPYEYMDNWEKFNETSLPEKG